MVNNLLSAMLGIVIGVALLPTVTQSIENMSGEDLSGPSESMLDLIPQLFVIFIVAGTAAYIKIDGKKN